MMIPDGEYERFKSNVKAESARFGLTIDEYIKKVWYHEQAAKLGEYTALVLVDSLINALATGELEIA